VRGLGAPIWAGLATTALFAAVQLTAALTGSIPPALAVCDFLAGCAFAWFGVAAWRRRPQSRIGPLLILGGVGLAPVNLIFVDDLPLLRTIGLMGLQTFAAPLVHLLLGFPTGRVTGRRDKVIVVGAYLHLTVQWWVFLLFYEPPPGCPDCMRSNLLGVLGDRGTWDVLWVVQGVMNALFGAGLVVLLALAYRRASTAARRARGLVLGAGGLVAVIAIVTTPAAYGMIDGTEPATSMQAAWTLAWWVLPASVLLAISRTRASRVTMGELVERLLRRPAPAGLRDALADALGDPTLELGFWVPEAGGWRAADGRPLSGGRARATTELVRDGRRQAILVHDPVLLEDPAGLEAVRAAAGVALDTERLQAELRAQIQDVLAAQRRVLGATDDARRRIECELRDGPQRRLLDLSATLAMTDEALPRERRADLLPLLEASTELVSRVRRELRDLAAGVFPESLQHGGIGAAVRELAELSPLPVALDVDLRSEPPEEVAAAAWFACREALANAAKHAKATALSVAVRCEGGELTVTVTDDGTGGADAAGTGLRGLADRIEARGGRLEVTSPPGRGTTVRVELPLGVLA
jgi:signal transduction histidine kinase